MIAGNRNSGGKLGNVQNNTNNNKVYLLKRPYQQSHSKALDNKNFYAERYKKIF